MPVAMNKTGAEPARRLSPAWAGCRLTLPSRPQMPRAGGKAGCMARRASSQETTWRRSERGPGFASCLPACQGARPCQRGPHSLAALARRSSPVASSPGPGSGGHHRSHPRALASPMSHALPPVPNRANSRIYLPSCLMSIIELCPVRKVPSTVGGTLTSETSLLLSSLRQ